MHANFFLRYMRVKSRVRVTEILNRHALRDSQRNLKKKVAMVCIACRLEVLIALRSLTTRCKFVLEISTNQG